MKALKSEMIIGLVMGLCFLLPSLGFGDAKSTDQKIQIQKMDESPNAKREMKAKLKPKSKVRLVRPDLTISKISIRKSGGYIYITPTIKNLTSKGCENVDLKFIINNDVEQPYMGVMFEGNSEFDLNGLGFEDEEDDSCSIKIQITRGCRELNLSNNVKEVNLIGIGSAARTIRF